MSATDELRRMLEERGVEWSDSSNESVLHTTWNDMNCWFNEFSDGWTAWGMFERGTPQQAIDATLGRRTTTRHGKFRTKYGRSVPCCECCGYGIGDERWHYCPSCGARVVSE